MNLSTLDTMITSKGVTILNMSRACDICEVILRDLFRKVPLNKQASYPSHLFNSLPLICKAAVLQITHTLLVCTYLNIKKQTNHNFNHNLMKIAQMLQILTLLVHFQQPGYGWIVATMRELNAHTCGSSYKHSCRSDQEMFSFLSHSL